MRRTIFLMVIIPIFTNFSFAQVRATTESGNNVLLFDNGTWKYDEKTAIAGENSVVATAALTVATIDIDSSRETSTDPKELFYLPSPRLVKYFGESGGNIRCKLSCSNTLGVVKVHFSWEFPVSDGPRYFGWFRKGSKVTFAMDDGQMVELLMEIDSKIKRFEKHNYSAYFNTSVPLTKAQIELLSTQSIEKMEVEWKKKSETYDLEESLFLVNTLPTVF